MREQDLKYRPPSGASGGMYGPPQGEGFSPAPGERPRTVPWSALDVLVIVGLIIVVYILMGIVLGTLLELTTILDANADIEEMLMSPLANSFLWILQWSLTLGVTFTYFKLRGYELSLQTLGFRKASVGLSAVLIAGVLFGSFIIQGLYVTYVTEPTQEQVTSLFGTSVLGFILAMVIVAILTPVVEELFFRGIIHQGLEQRLGFLPGAVLSSMIFMLAHVDPTVYIPIFVLGFGFAFLMSQTKSVWPSTVAHLIWNSLGVVAQFLAG